MLAFPPSTVGVMRGQGVDLHTKVEQFLLQGGREGQGLGELQAALLQQHLGARHEVALRHPVVATVPVDLIAAVNTDGDGLTAYKHIYPRPGGHTRWHRSPRSYHSRQTWGACTGHRPAQPWPGRGSRAG